jgi:hypothetical protein
VNSENSCLEQPVLNVRRIREELKVWMPDGNTHLTPMCCAFASARRLFNRTGSSTRGKQAPRRLFNRTTVGASRQQARVKPRKAWFNRTWCKGCAFAPSRVKHHEVVLNRTAATRTGGSTRVKRHLPLNRTEQAPGQCPDHERPSRSSRRPSP